ncbi:hypothetical protein BN1723_012396 [Verticillium longisporum]|uniref:Peptidase S8/S53 domain-containing protein n=1 Tax=Verticillium longisporum TaxID=100787 RepID=A0A0G4LHG8_VERLO|nr:hypothetical protein BN1723_012396 [Verticillium longisporum]
MRFDSAFPWILAASLGLARESQDEDAIAPPMMKGKYAPGAYIAEISDGQLISSLGAQGGVTSVEERIRFDSTVFKGTSFNLGIVQKEDEEEVVRQVGASPEARNIWPVKVVSSPQPNLAWTAQGKPLVEVQRRQVGKDGHSPHIMTQADRFHAEGITEEGCLVEFGANVAGGSYDESQPPNPDGDPFEDCNGHATHVAEIIAALYNPLGFKGAAPGVKIGMFRALAALTLRQWTLPWLPLMKMEVTLSLASRTGKWLEPEAICIAGVAYCGNKVGGTEGLFGVSAPSIGDGVLSLSSFQHTHDPSYDAPSGQASEISNTTRVVPSVLSQAGD